MKFCNQQNKCSMMAGHVRPLRHLKKDDLIYCAMCQKIFLS